MTIKNKIEVLVVAGSRYEFDYWCHKHRVFGKDSIFIYVENYETLEGRYERPVIRVGRYRRRKDATLIEHMMSKGVEAGRV